MTRFAARLPWRSTTFAGFGLIALALTPAHAADPLTGAWNDEAGQLALRSPLVTSAKQLIEQNLATIADPTLKAATLDAVTNRNTCVQHRAGVDAAIRDRVLASLKTEGLVDPEDDAKFPGGLVAGVFPPVKDEGSACPHLPMVYEAAPGSAFGGHHSYPGGLPVHVAMNLSSALSLADSYRRIYGYSQAGGLPQVTAFGSAAPTPAGADITIDQDLVVAAPLWHDWAKTIVFQWTATGSEFPELNFGGNGKTDNWGAAGNSKTGAHHILGIAEVIKRGLPPAYVVTQASAHIAPTGGDEYRVVNWMRAAAIIAQIDPVEKGYLVKDEAGRLRLPPVRQLAGAAIQKQLPNEPNLLVEYVLHNLSDADYTYSGPAVAEAQVALRNLAQRYGYDFNDVTRYNTRYRNPVLTHLSAERLQIILANKGIEAVATELDKLKTAGLI